MPGMGYVDGYRRYRVIESLTEDELREKVAVNRMFLDEVIHELKEIRS